MRADVAVGIRPRRDLPDDAVLEVLPAHLHRAVHTTGWLWRRGEAAPLTLSDRQVTIDLTGADKPA